MISVSLQQLATLTEGQLTGSPTLTFTEVTTDTRKVTSGCLFVALIGERFDAHDFISDAIAAGASALLVSKQIGRAHV